MRRFFKLVSWAALLGAGLSLSSHAAIAQSACAEKYQKVLEEKSWDKPIALGAIAACAATAGTSLAVATGSLTVPVSTPVAVGGGLIATGAACYTAYSYSIDEESYQSRALVYSLYLEAQDLVLRRNFKDDFSAYSPQMKDLANRFANKGKKLVLENILEAMDSGKLCYDDESFAVRSLASYTGLRKALNRLERDAATKSVTF